MKNRMRLAKLGRPTAARKALFRNQVAALAEHGRIRTTLPKAKALRHFADRIVTWAKKGTPQYRVRAQGFLYGNKQLVNKLWSEYAPLYADRAGGYTRVLRAGYRTGDRAPMAIIEYVARPGEVRAARPGTAAGASKAAAVAAGQNTAPAAPLN